MKFFMLIATFSLSTAFSYEMENNAQENAESHAYRYSYPKTQREYHMGVSASYLYWQLEQNFVYFGEIDSTLLHDNNDKIPFIFLENNYTGYITKLVSDEAFSSSGFRVELTGYNDENTGLESRISYTNISHQQTTIDCNCERFFTMNGWVDINRNTTNPPEGFPPENGKGAVNLLGLSHFSKANANLQKISNASKSVSWQNVDLLLHNTALYPLSKRVAFSGGIGLEFDWFKYAIRMKGATGYFNDNLEFLNFTTPSNPFTLSTFITNFFDYTLKNSPFLVGPFLRSGFSLFHDPLQSSFFFDGFLKIAALYAKNDLKISYLIGVSEDNVTKQVDCTPNLDFKSTILHGQIGLSLGYSYIGENVGGDISVGWELNELLEFFPASISEITTSSLGYQGLTASVGIYF